MAEAKEIFLSHCVASMGEKAMTLYEIMLNEGCSTFICTKMDPGDNFRRQITVNAANCKIMIILLDERWAKSKECLSEFNCAYSCYNKVLTPQIIPIVMGGFQWISPLEHPETHCITSNFQCLAPKDNNNGWEELIETLLQRINSKIAELKSTTDAANKIASQNRAFIDFVTCEICQNLFTNPKMLPCCHTFCKNCLINWKKVQKDLPCPKCRLPCPEEIENLKTNFMANQMIDVINKQNEHSNEKDGSDLKKDDETSTYNSETFSGPEMVEYEPELAAWFKANKIPAAVSKTLVEYGFESLDVVLEITEEDIKTMGLKLGHAKKLLKSVNDHNGISDIGNTQEVDSYLENWKLIKELYDDRVLTWGTTPNDSLKFWASLTKQMRENIVGSVKKLGVDVKEHPKLEKTVKADCLQKISHVLCDAGEFGDAMNFASSALAFESCPDRQIEMKILLIYATDGKLKEPMLVKDQKDSSGYQQLAELCREVIRDQKHLSNSKLCKVYIMKAFTLYAMVIRWKSKFPHCYEEAEADLAKAVDLCQKENLEGLKAEAVMTKALLMATVTRNEKTRQTFLEARKLCLIVYGEFSTLNARIYYNLGIDFEVKKDKAKAYECFRRCWLIDRQVFGVHHPTTQKSGSVLTDDYKDVAKKLKDTLPDTHDEPTQKDREYSKRVKFLDKMTK